jgi:hypothetical protein
MLDKRVEMWYNVGNVTGIVTGNVTTRETE